ncbi:unnamed protein product [Caenorhabditis sp. 36 PRJEB53466]|nr:unnamed protein product [Caenorhabditis sp. 36 PRJEB53466]
MWQSIFLLIASAQVIHISKAIPEEIREVPLVTVRGVPNSLSEFLNGAWERRLDFKFETSYPSFFVLCQEKGTVHRRAGAVLEIIAKHIRTGFWEKHTWIAFFSSAKGNGYRVEYLKDIGVFALEGPDKVHDDFEPEIVADTMYDCPKYADDKRKFSTSSRKEAIAREVMGHKDEF